jgi:YVTN family beta-propeller protein
MRVRRQAYNRAQQVCKQIPLRLLPMKKTAVVCRVAYAAACALLFPLSATAGFAQSVIATIPAQEGPFGLPLSIAVDPLKQLVYIAGNGVEVVNQRTNTPVRTLDIGNNNESSIAINPVTQKLYVTDYYTGMYVFDLKTNTVVSTLPLFVAAGVAYNPLTNRVYTLDNVGNVWVNDGTTGALIHEIVTGASQASTITINPVTNRIYLPEQTEPGQLVVVDASTNAVTTVPLQGNLPYDAAVDELHNIIYVSESGGQVDVLDGKTNTETATITGIPLQPGALSVDPLTRQVYLSNQGQNEVEVINGATNTLTSKVISVGATPNFSTIDLVHGLLYVGNSAEFANGSPMSVSVISLK